MATTRLRQAFRFSDDYVDDLQPDDGIDEQEQERIIAGLATRDATLNEKYRKLILAIPILSLVFFARIYITSPTHTHFLNLSLVTENISLLIALDIASQGGVARLRKALASYPPTLSLLASIRALVSIAFEKTVGTAWSLIFWINGGLCLLLWGMWYRGSSDGSNETGIGNRGGNDISSRPVWYIIPPTVSFLILLLAHREFHAIDVKALENLRYNYKGA